MFDHAVQASEAMKQAAQHARVVLIPARSGCETCNRVQMSAAPALGRCEHCGSEQVVLGDTAEMRATEGPWRNAA